MKVMKNILLWVVGIASFCFFVNWLVNSAIESCEVDLAKRLNTETVYVNGKCIAKGYGVISGG